MKLEVFRTPFFFLMLMCALSLSKSQNGKSLNRSAYTLQT